MMDYKKDTTPHNWWAVENVFTKRQITALLKEFPEEAELEYSGKRDSNNDFRKFAKRGTKLGNIFKEWNNNEFKMHITDVTGVDMSQGKLRVELCMDGPGFWLETHADIPEKLMTLQVYLGEGEENWGTVLYSQPETVYKELPFIQNTGWLAVMGEPVLHGVSQNVVDNWRKSVIINYVRDWRDTDQLW